MVETFPDVEVTLIALFIAKLVRTVATAPWVPRPIEALDRATIFEIHTLALELGLAEPARRALLLDDPALAAKLSQPSLDAADQQLADLQALNRMREANGEPLRLRRWLETAAVSTRPDSRAECFVEYATRLEGITRRTPRRPAPRGGRSLGRR